MSRQNFFIQRNLRGFALIELLVIVFIIGLISIIILVNLSGARKKARIKMGLSFSQSIQNALGLYAVGIWNFESIELGEVIDDSGYGNNGTVYGAELTEGVKINGGTGNALQFDGTNDYVAVGHNNSLDQTTELSVLFWVKGINEDAPNAYWGMLDKESYQNNGWSIFLLNGTATNLKKIHLRLSYSTLQTTSLTADEKDLTSWSHVTVIFDNSEAVIYLDGQSIKSGTLAISSVVTNTLDLRIGLESNRYFNGIIDEIRIYSRALTTAEIQKHYTEGLEKHKNLAKN